MEAVWKKPVWNVAYPHILEPQNLTFSFRHNFTKKYFFSKVRLIPDAARSDLSKEPIKSGYLCKSAKKIRFAVKTGPKRQVRYMSLPSYNGSTAQKWKLLI